MRPAYWARIQSSLKRLPTSSVTLEKIFGYLRYQGLDPGVELLLGQVLGELLYAGLPKALASVSAGLAHRGCDGIPRSFQGAFLLWIGGTVQGGGL